MAAAAGVRDAVVRGVRSRLYACCRQLRTVADKAGVRDVLRALEDGPACREILELLVRASAAEPAEAASSSVAAVA